MKKHTLLIIGMLKELREDYSLQLAESIACDLLALLYNQLISESDYNMAVDELNSIKMENENNLETLELGIAI